MRILYVVHAFLPESTGGTEVHTLLLARALAARHEVAVLYRVHDPAREEGALEEGTYQGLRVFRLVNNFSWSPDADYEFYNPRLEPGLERVLDAVRPDLVHLHHLGGGLSTSFVGLLRRRGLPTALTLHDYWFMCPRSTLWTSDGRLCPGPDGGLRCTACWLADHYGAARPSLGRIRGLGLGEALRRAPRWLADRLLPARSPSLSSYHATRLMLRDDYMRRLLAREVDLLLAPSRFLLERYVAWGVPRERLRHVPNGVDPARLADVPAALPGGEVLQAVYLGALAPHKGVHLLVEALNRLPDAPIALDIYGGAGASPEAQAYVARLRAAARHPRVRFQGRVPNEEVGRVLGGADLVVVPSVWYENSPLTILEALHARRPVLVADIGGMAELVPDGRNGLTFRAGDAEDMADRLRYLSAHREALAALQPLPGAAPTAEDVAQRVEGAYRELLQGAPRAGEA